MQQHAAFHITCADGHLMPVYSWLPAGDIKAVLHITHGMAEYGLRYAPTAILLAEKGFAVYANDHRGHGPEVAPANVQQGNLGKLGLTGDNWFYKQIDDLRLVIQHHKNTHPGKKILLMGHSMGSFLSQRYFQLHGSTIDGLILSATNGQPDPLLPFGIMVAWLQMKIQGKNHRSHLIDKLSFQQFNKSFAPNRTDHDWLSRDENAVDKYLADPLCGYVCSASFFYYFFKGISHTLNKKNIQFIPKNIPVYAFAGDRDPVGLRGKGFLQLIAKWKAAGVQDISYNLYKNGRHEMLNDINRQEVLDNLLTWIYKQEIHL